ncbi:hypothetical protein BDZ85DRAFT_206344 [Elsinoe ampelina]|uniref:NAD(P)-binding protein n=1 Tax=Elsinoe ampelina TaxID=302913 RepID=A0A6A6G158_9PEZI|nr:hypothetical protein BDZ85DRAFT_206344 [Elsinoe ampelina]
MATPTSPLSHPPPSPPPSAPPATEPDLKPPRVPKFPAHNAPRVWFLTCASSPIGISLSRHLLAHGDYIIAGLGPAELSTATSPFRLFLAEIASTPAKTTWKPRLLPVPLDVRNMSSCQSAIATGTASFGRIDILFSCASHCVVGAVEELGGGGGAPLARTLVREQFEVNFFGAVNVIKAVLPGFRAKRNGHIVVLTGITGHLGTPGLGIYCASQWAVEGYCDSLAYEVAPFNIRTTIVQPNVEVGVLTNKIVGAPPLGAYAGEVNQAPLFRDILSGLLDRLEGGSSTGAAGPSTGDLLHQNRISEVVPQLGKGLKERLVAETVYAVAAIGGHDNPPSRHIVGHEGVASVKEKLKTVSEELEDFVEVSAAVDMGREDVVMGLVPG